MHALLRRVVILWMFVAAIVLLWPADGPQSAASPYQSALSGLSSGVAFAAPRCGNTFCDFIPELKRGFCEVGDESQLTNCVKSRVGGCRTVDC